MMPEMNGLEMIQTAHSRYPDTIYVIVSAYGEFELAKKAIDLQVYNYLLKPIDISEFIKMMDNVMDSAHQLMRKRSEKQAQLASAQRNFLLESMRCTANSSQTLESL